MTHIQIVLSTVVICIIGIFIWIRKDIDTDNLDHLTRVVIVGAFVATLLYAYTCLFEGLLKL